MVVSSNNEKRWQTAKMKKRQFKILTVVGARPQFIKAAMVSRAITRHKKIDEFFEIIEEIVHTGQHYDELMSEIFFRDMGIPQPVVNLQVNNAGHGEMTGRMLMALERELTARRPDCVLVYGDTNSTLAGALAAAKLHIPVAHVEAGLRSFNKRMPEEINRILTDHVSTFLFCPTQTAVENLRNEGISDNSISSGPSEGHPHVIHVGDVMYDATLFFAHLAEKESTILKDHELASRQYLLATVHRAENTDNMGRLMNILIAFGKIRETIIFPVHPRTRRKIIALQKQHVNIIAENVKLVDPVTFLDMIKLEKHAMVILTDSGGIQKEAYFHKVPCVTLREETEWLETVEAGWNTLVGTDVDKIVAAALSARPGTELDQYGEGHAGERIVEILMDSWAARQHRRVQYP
jgi:UDP-GlcNAc3NAcA epimerase